MFDMGWIGTIEVESITAEKTGNKVELVEPDGMAEVGIEVRESGSYDLSTYLEAAMEEAGANLNRDEVSIILTFDSSKASGGWWNGHVSYTDVNEGTVQDEHYDGFNDSVTITFCPSDYTLSLYTDNPNGTVIAKLSVYLTGNTVEPPEEEPDGVVLIGESLPSSGQGVTADLSSYFQQAMEEIEAEFGQDEVKLILTFEAAGWWNGKVQLNTVEDGDQDEERYDGFAKLLNTRSFRETTGWPFTQTIRAEQEFCLLR